MKVFDYKDYKVFVLDWMSSLPHKGRGQSRLMAQHLRVNSVLISQILRGQRDFTLEQAFDACEFIGLSENETRYFVLLVEHARAGTHRLKLHFSKQLDEIRQQSLDLQNRVQPEKKLSPEVAAEYYSSWIYSAVRLATSIPELQSLEALAQHFALPRSKLKPIVALLLKHSLCIESEGRIKMGPRSTHLGSDSPMVFRHHSNWRLKGLSRGTPLDSDEIFYTSPVSVAASDLQKIRAMILEWVEEFSSVVKPSKEEAVACLNIDWFKV